MSDAKKSDAKVDAAIEGKDRGSSKLLVVLVVTNTLLSAGALASALLRPHAAQAVASGGEHGEAAGAKGPGVAKDDGEVAEAKDGKPAAPPPIARIENIVVRLRNPEIDRFARLTLDVELGTAEHLAAFQANLPRIRDIVITTISDRAAEQLAGSVGIAKLKDELGDKIGAALGGHAVKTVYLSEFVVQ